MTTSFESIRNQKKAYQERIQKEAKPILTEHLQVFLDRFPEVVGLRWVQYTPSFNDGDPCRFSVHDVYVGLKRAVPLTEEEDEEEDDDYGWATETDTVWASPYGHLYDGRITEETKQIWKAHLELDDDICEAAFDDGVKVKVLRTETGLKFDVEEYYQH